MKLVIDIDEDVYTRLFDSGIQDNEIAVNDVCEMARALRLGTPLPKGHGRLIDTNQYKRTLVGYIDENKNSDDMFLAGCGDGAYHAMCMLKDIPTIIEAADKSEV